MRQFALRLALPRAIARTIALVIALLCALALPAAARADEGAPQPVKDPYYGVSLFDFYQQRYFTALADLMVAQHFGRVSHQAEEAEILRGGLYLSYGLHREAAEIFTRLINAGASPTIRDRAWYYLAKIRYQRGLFADAQDALDRVKGLLPGDLQVDRELLQGNLAMARGDYVGAARLLAGVVDRDKADVYLRFNLGVALLKSSGSDADRGTELLDAIGSMPAATEELRSVRDKANLALGFAALQGQEASRARRYLERVRLNGMLANKALLAFGWAAEAMNQPKEALVPWLELTARDPSDAAVLEARLAVPYALAQLDAYGQSMDGYRDAIAAFDAEKLRLDESIAAIRAGKLIDGLIAANPGEEMGWLWNIDRLPAMPHVAHLAPVLAQHEFQEAFKNYRDLQFLQHRLRQWQEELAIVGDMLDTRRTAFAERLPLIRERERAAGIERLAQRRDTLAAELQDAQSRADGMAFADDRERALAERLARDRDILARAAGDPQLASLAERYRRVEGALAWQLSQELAPRLWEARKSLKSLGDGIAQARDHDAELAHAQQSEPARLDAFARRRTDLQQRVAALLPRLAELAQLQREAVQELAVAGLQEQQDRLAVYANQARLAVAQIYDRAAQSKDAPHAPAP
jgi:hypothetical protein